MVVNIYYFWGYKTLNMKIGQALLKSRKYKGLKQTDAALRAGITQTYLSLIESGKKIPTVDVIENISDVYGIPFQIMMWHSLTEKEVRKSKLDIYRKLKPTIDNLIADIFN